MMKPYLIGLHVTIDGWRSNRDVEGWRMSKFIPDSVMIKEEDGNWTSSSPDMEAPVLVKAVPHFAADLEALVKLCKADSPSLRAVRCRESGTFLYGFGDASGQAFGASVRVQVADDIRYQCGQWVATVTEEESSNWRKLANLVAFVKELVESGDYDGFELFIFY
jgi:hypothetical protein